MLNVLTMTAFLHVETCCECGVMFAMPENLHTIRKTNGEAFWCPNGHQQHYNVEKIDAEKKEAMRLALLAVHRAEQAEARAAEGKPANDPPADPLNPALNKYGRYQCPCCANNYTYAPALAKHLRKLHPTDPKADALVKACPMLAK